MGTVAVSRLSRVRLSRGPARRFATAALRTAFAFAGLCSYPPASAVRGASHPMENPAADVDPFVSDRRVFPAMEPGAPFHLTGVQVELLRA